MFIALGSQNCQLRGTCLISRNALTWGACNRRISLQNKWSVCAHVQRACSQGQESGSTLCEQLKLQHCTIAGTWEGALSDV
eukprot:1143356-Pelagomonas_calceolata.AAC.2